MASLPDKSHKIAVVIPTIGRYAELRRMMNSLAAQTRLPDQVLIVGRGAGNAEIAREFPQLNAEFIHMPYASICDERNRGVRSARPEIDLIAFMDDDIVLESGAVEALLRFWENEPEDLGGASCHLVNHPKMYARRLKSLWPVARLGLYDLRKGAVLPSGIHTMMLDIEEAAYVQWLATGAVAYSRRVLAEFAFDEWFQSYSYLEDLDLSYRVGKKYRLAVVAGARYCHYPSSTGRPDPYIFGKKEVLNRLHFVSKHPELSLPLCCLALSIRAAMSLWLCFSRRDSGYARRAAGNIAGFLSALSGGVLGLRRKLRPSVSASRIQDKARPAGRARVLVCAYACVADPSTRLPGGGDAMAWNVIRRLGREHQLWVLTAAQNREPIAAESRKQTLPDVHFVYVDLPACLHRLLRRPAGIQLYAYLWQWRAYFVARLLHRRIGFDAFHHLTYENDWMASPAGALLPVPYLRGPGGGAHRIPLEFRRRYPLKNRMWEQIRAVGQWMFRHDPFFILGQSRAKAILVCNHESLVAVPSKWKSKTRLFPVNGVPPEAFGPNESSSGASNDFRIVTAGRLVPLKAFDLAVRAFAQFVKRIRAAAPEAEVSLSIVGDGPERKRLEALVRSIGLEDVIRLVAWQPRAQLWARMRSSDVFLFPSLRDGGGAVVVEAMAAGIPVVCLDMAGPAMHVTDACGIKVKPNSPEQVVSDLAAALEVLYRQPELRRKMGLAARERARDSYLWDVFVARLSHVYQETFATADPEPAPPLESEDHAELLPGLAGPCA
jgi:glycosyltransferase involved in cell wall biosynthesis/GT2 family glycosyltransferase